MGKFIYSLKMEQVVNYTKMEYVLRLLMELDHKMFILNQISKKFQELLLVYVLINISFMKMLSKSTNVKNF